MAPSGASTTHKDTRQLVSVVTRTVPSAQVFCTIPASIGMSVVLKVFASTPLSSRASARNSRSSTVHAGSTAVSGAVSADVSAAVSVSVSVSVLSVSVPSVSVSRTVGSVSVLTGGVSTEGRQPPIINPSNMVKFFKSSLRSSGNLTTEPPLRRFGLSRSFRRGRESP